MWLEPVTEGTAQHAGGCARRAALHDVVLAVKEIRGIARIKRHSGESGERAKNGARPFPAVADKIVNAERAGAIGMRTDGNGIPICEIKVAVFVAGRDIAPGVLSLGGAVRRAIGGAVKLLFVRKLAAEPVCVGSCFGMADIDGPIEGEAHFFEHAEGHPDISIAAPECGMFNAGRFFPCPAFSCPQRARTITAGLYETQKGSVGDIVTLDRE